ncbi:MAG TPA: hypothetical protein VFZ64_14560 [Nocardioidaceae bacterium]
MPRRPRPSAVTRRPGAARVVALLAPMLLVAACTAGDETGGPTPASPTPGEARLDLSGLPVPRAEVCDALAEDDAARALGGPVEQTAHYGNGDDVEIAPGVVDVSHEYGCVFEAADGTVARLWIFARPVTTGEARALVRRARRGRDCAFPDVVVFGRPGLTSVCEVPADRPGGETAFRARFEGLFDGGTWVGCEVTDPAGAEPESPADASAGPDEKAPLLERSEQWCTGAVTAVSAT